MKYSKEIKSAMLAPVALIMIIIGAPFAIASFVLRTALSATKDGWGLYDLFISSAKRACNEED